VFHRVKRLGPAAALYERTETARWEYFKRYGVRPAG